MQAKLLIADRQLEDANHSLKLSDARKPTNLTMYMRIQSFLNADHVISSLKRKKEKVRTKNWITLNGLWYITSDT